eukprot:CAMPEP_0170201176 /NCGR_PEP_ID=MMETSP0116_2-20130129/37_1 /TAXON_ID=400756 /ORGANISM="Durinskia baltica, Strain CSIRO CS-38" /LENGTH=64 /DNA_ID=CAMNT_0010451377 /DNA_START=111 /DNA_END=305 /DNA_ORIENTATION=-
MSMLMHRVNSMFSTLIVAEEALPDSALDQKARRNNRHWKQGANSSPRDSMALSSPLRDGGAKLT